MLKRSGSKCTTNESIIFSSFLTKHTQFAIVYMEVLYDRGKDFPLEVTLDREPKLVYKGRWVQISLPSLRINPGPRVRYAMDVILLPSQPLTSHVRQTNATFRTLYY